MLSITKEQLAQILGHVLIKATQGNNSTQALSTKNVLFGCKKIGRQGKKKKEKRKDKKEPT